MRSLYYRRITLEIFIEKEANQPLRMPWMGFKMKSAFFSLIPISILAFYGIEDKNAWFFGHDYIEDYRYRIGNTVYNMGLMVGHFAVISIVSIIGLLIAWITYEFLKAVKHSINNRGPSMTK